MCLVSSLILHKNENRQMDTNAFDFKKSFLYFHNFYSFILANNIDIYLSFVIIYVNLLKYIAVTAQLLQ